MKKLIFLLIVISAACNFTFAQTLIGLDKVKQIKLLESNREDVRKIFADYNLDISDDLGHYEWFSTKNAKIRVSYSKGDCLNNSEDWNVSEWKVTQINISPLTTVKLEDTGIDFSKYRKGRYANASHLYIYFTEDFLTALEINKDKVEDVIFTPSKKHYSLLCNQKIIKMNSATKSWFYNPNGWRFTITESNAIPDVANLILSTSEIVSNCSMTDLKRNKTCPDNVKQIAVFAVAEDLEYDTLTYDYKVSGGKIIGQGSKVVWDLSGVKPGTYTITAAVDDGCGFCGTPKTKSVVVKECSGCDKK